MKRAIPILPDMEPLTRDEKIALAVCLIISGTFIVHLWQFHYRDKFLKKLFWSFVLLIPLIGWIFYGAFYQPLADGQNPISPSNDIDGA